MAELIPAAALRTMRWKNGGGATTEVAVYPPAATLEDFVWRLSIAEVDRSGPFSAFPGIDRILMLLEGAGMRLQQPLRDANLAARFAQCAFAGDDTVRATLHAGPVRDCNLMLRRPARGALQAVAAAQATVGAAAFRVCHAWAGSIRVAVGDAPLRVLHHRATLLLDAADAPLSIMVDATAPGATCIVATIDLAP